MFRGSGWPAFELVCGRSRGWCIAGGCGVPGKDAMDYTQITLHKHAHIYRYSQNKTGSLVIPLGVYRQEVMSDATSCDSLGLARQEVVLEKVPQCCVLTTLTIYLKYIFTFT